MSLAKRNRLRDAKEIKAVFSYGRRTTMPFCDIYYKRHDGGPAKFAFIVSKGTEKQSSKRNTMRRRASEWVRNMADGVFYGYDVVFVFKKSSAGVTRPMFYSLLKELLEKTHLL